jgi:hypothetical protein
VDHSRLTLKDPFINIHGAIELSSNVAGFNNIRPKVFLPNVFNEIRHCGFVEDFWKTLGASPVTMATTK